MNRDWYNLQRPESYDKKGYDYKRLRSYDKSEQTVKDRISNCYRTAVGQIRNGYERLSKKNDKQEKGRSEEKEWLLKKYNEEVKQQYMISKEKEWWERKN